ncbi:MAG TPA: FAD-dependent monooxygenase [Alcanivoracaceae bacterium]|nr:FAD-dependent monooxygenase [Alcanivoracaceae bacterium]
MSKQYTDVVIVGGGMAGGMQAVALAETGLSVRLLDAAPAPEMPTGLCATRVVALTEASQRMLERLGIWSLMPPERVQPYHSMHVWDGSGDVQFDGAELGAAHLGWIVENNAVAAAMYQRTQSLPNVTWQQQEKIVRYERTEKGWLLTSAGGDEYHCALLIGADGARSSVREHMGIAGVPEFSGHVAIVGAIRTERPHGECARQRFLETGPLALLPAAGDGHDVSIVWSLTPEEAQRLYALPEEAFNEALTIASNECLGALTLQTQRAQFLIHYFHASGYHKPFAALISDAAHVVHPLAGQGINLGLLDAAVLAEEIQRAQRRGLPFNHITVLERYERRRRFHNGSMVRALKGFKVLFEQRSLEVRWLRNTGMNIVNRFFPIKQRLAEHALGRTGDLPQLARP